MPSNSLDSGVSSLALTGKPLPAEVDPAGAITSSSACSIACTPSSTACSATSYLQADLDTFEPARWACWVGLSSARQHDMHFLIHYLLGEPLRDQHWQAGPDAVRLHGALKCESAVGFADVRALSASMDAACSAQGPGINAAPAHTRYRRLKQSSRESAAASYRRTCSSRWSAGYVNCSSSLAHHSLVHLVPGPG